MKSQAEDEHLPYTAVTVQYKESDTAELREVTVHLPVMIGRDARSGLRLRSPSVSRHHAQIVEEGGSLFIIDQQSGNGVTVNNERVNRGQLAEGDAIQIGACHLVIKALGTSSNTQDQPSNDDDQNTLIFNEKTDLLDVSHQSGIVDNSFPPPAFRSHRVSVQSFRSSRLPVEECTYLAIGGGMGSFVWINFLRICGAMVGQMMAIGFEPKPYGRYRRLCQSSQIPDHERLRSDSGSCPGNIWGWPGYAVREAWQSFRTGDVGHAGRLFWKIFNEPIFAETYTPRAGDVYAEVDREAKRIDWDKIWRQGRVKAIRKTDDGRYAVAYSQTGANGENTHHIVLANYVHVAVGYPAIRLLPDLYEYRQKTGDFKSVVNAYEEHDHIYEHLQKQGGSIIVRGRGIVASRILQRLYEVRQHNKNVAILHLTRNPVAEGNRYEWARRLAVNHWETQPFNWPRACWGGDLRRKLEQANDEERKRLLELWGGTTTADRQDWMAIVEQGIREAWLQPTFGHVEKVERNANNQLVTTIRGSYGVKGKIQLEADFIIDATGLESGIDANPLLKDLLEHYRLARNPQGRLQVTNHFEVEGMQNGSGRLYSSGVMTLGGPYAAVDSFLGLQFAALRSVDDLVANNAPGLRYLDGLYSVKQWIRWAKGAKP